MSRRLPFALLMCALAGGACQALAQERPPVEATTSAGDAVILHPNGRWEYRDAQKAAVAKQVAAQFPENQVCPPGAQGRLFGVGRCIMPGDKEYNRGSMNPNRR